MPTSASRPLRGNDALNSSELDSTTTGQPLRGTSSRERIATATLWIESGQQGARRWRLPPRFAVSQLPATQRHSPSGVNRPLRARFNITRHSAKLRQSLRWRSAWWRNRCAPCGFAERRAMSGAPARLPGQHVLRTVSARRCARPPHGVRQVSVTGRAPRVACRRAAPAVRSTARNPTPTPDRAAKKKATRIITPVSARPCRPGCK